MLLVSRPLDLEWMTHHDATIDRVMAEHGFSRGGSGVDLKSRWLQYDHDSWETEAAFYNLAKIDEVATSLPGVYLEMQLCPYRARWAPDDA